MFLPFNEPLNGNEEIFNQSQKWKRKLDWFEEVIHIFRTLGTQIQLLHVQI